MAIAISVLFAGIRITSYNVCYTKLLRYAHAHENFIKSVDKGILKIMSKMGISTLRSYHGAQMFEAVGVSQAVVDKCFIGTPTKIGGVGFEEIAQESILDHNKAFDPAFMEDPYASKGSLAFRKYGEKHGWNPETIGLLQWATSET